MGSPGIEQLECRRLLASISVNVGQVVRTVNDDALGVNVAWWDSALNTAQTKSMVQAAGMTSFRFPGGSSADEFHFTDPPSYNGKGTAATFAKFIESVGGAGMVTLDYGSGSPQEAAAFLAYLNAPTGSTANIGVGQTWPTGGSAWTTRDYKTAGYWGGIRAASPLPTDDGLNFLRIGHAAPFAFHHFEIGNEEYGISWETDHHSPAHDPATYVAFAKQFAALAQQIDPTIAIGLDIVAGSEQNNWTSNMLSQCNSQSYTPDFLIDHNYVYGPAQENDNTLLHSVSVAGYSGWSSRAAQYRSELVQLLGATAASHVRLLATEFNSVYSGPGKQTTSLVGGLFAADAIGSILQTEYDGLWFWDLRNGWDTANNNSASLYGWRTGGDYGMIGSSGTAPQTGTYVPYPTYFAEQLASKLAVQGASVVGASSNDANLATYAVRLTSGNVRLLVINKSATSSISGTFQFSGGFAPAAQAQIWQYGKAEDTAQSQTTDGHASLSSSTPTLALNGASFAYSFPSYSMTVMDLAPVAPPQVLAAGYPYNAAPNQVQFTFNVDVSASLSAADLVLSKLDPGTPPAVQSVQWNSSNLTATFLLTPGSPSDGNYRATLSGAGVKNAAGNTLTGDYSFDFFVLAGDANHDRAVDTLDFNALAANFGGNGKTFSQGDFNYDGIVDTLDFNTLAGQFGKTLAPPAAGVAAQISPAAVSPTRAAFSASPVVVVGTADRMIDLLADADPRLPKSTDAGR